jgi:hypothetical protein
LWAVNFTKKGRQNGQKTIIHPPQSFLTKFLLLLTTALFLTLTLVSCGGKDGSTGSTINGRWTATVIVKNEYSSPITRLVLIGWNPNPGTDPDETYLNKSTNIAKDASQSFTFSIDYQYLLGLKYKITAGSEIKSASAQDFTVGDGETRTLTLKADGTVSVSY